MPTISFEVTGNPHAAYQFALGNLGAQGFIITHQPDPFTTTMERGSKSRTLLFGALVGDNQHLRIKVTATSHGANTVISLDPDTSGVSAGIIGMNRASKFYSEVQTHLGNAFHGAGTLVSSYYPR